MYLKDDDEGFDPKDPTYHWEQHTSVDLDADYVVPLRSNLVLDGLTRLQSDERRQDQVLLSVKTYAVMSALYGGLHLAAWNSRFPTSVEMWLWRASGLVMVAAPVLSLIGVLGFALFRVEEKGKKRAGKMEGGKGWRTLVRGLLRAVSWFVGLLGSLAWCFGLVTAACTWVMYLFARSYVFGESFAALRAQERDVYRTVEWADFIPHAG